MDLLSIGCIFFLVSSFLEVVGNLKFLPTAYLFKIPVGLFVASRGKKRGHTHEANPSVFED